MTESDDTRIARDLVMLAALTRRVLERDIAIEGVTVTHMQLVVLEWLDVATPRRSRDVARFLSVSAPAATQVLARLKKRGLVEGHPSAADARAEDLRVTARGRKLLALHRRRRARTCARLTQDTTPGDRRRIVEGLEAALELLLSSECDVDDICLHCDALASPNCVMHAHGRVCPVRR